MNKSGIFGQTPHEFRRALELGAITPRQHSMGAWLTDESFCNRKTDGGLVTLWTSVLAQIYGVSVRTIERDLHALREGGWIDFPKPVAGRPWVVTVTGLYVPPKNDKNGDTNGDTGTASGVAVYRDTSDNETAGNPASAEGKRAKKTATLARARDTRRYDTKQTLLREGDDVRGSQTSPRFATNGETSWQEGLEEHAADAEGISFAPHLPHVEGEAA